MKGKRLFSVFGGFLIVGISLLTSCNKDFPRRMSVVTLPVDPVLAMAKGHILDMGEEGISQHGFVYDSNVLISANSQRVQLGSASNAGLYEALLTNLKPHTRYYINSFLISSSQTIYGNQVTFTTLANPVIPTVTTTTITNITQATATSGGNVTSDGGATVTARGVCWSTSSSPTTANSNTADGSGTGTFVSNLAGLTQNTLYYVRSYATNSTGTAYGNQVTFTSLTNPVIPTLTTTAIINITSTTATSGGNVTNDGGATVTARGVCWSTSSNPTTANSHTTDGSGTGVFSSSLTGLTANTLYYVRSYAANNIGTAYGNEVSFTTLSAFTCGSSITINHVAGSVAPVTKTVTYGTVTNIPGETSKCWITSNLGADHQATAKDDTTEPSAGWYWQFNRKQGYKHDGTTRTPNTTWITSINENIDWQSSNDPCSLELDSGWRIPTCTEWTNVDASGNWTDWNGPWNAALKLHAAGYLDYGSGSLDYRGTVGIYWSNTTTDAAGGCGLVFYSTTSYMYGYQKADGFTLRCVRDY